MNWIDINTEKDWQAALEQSHQQPIAVFKHSTRCSISSMAKSRLERSWNFEEAAIRPYFLDLIAHRSISNQIAQDVGVTHQSPQLIVIKNGKPIYDASHMTIYADDIEELV